jgi:phosphoglycolate phosphatase-like HAD superfamily hydrolase
MVGSSGHLTVLAEVLAERIGRRVHLTVRGESPTLDGVPIAGHVDSQVVRSVLGAEGKPPSDRVLEIIMDDYGQRYRERLRAGMSAGTVLDGVERFLLRVTKQGVAVGLATGNATAVARAKLEAVGLQNYFEFDAALGFGDSHADRLSVCKAALVGLRRRGTDSNNCALLGDTAADMSAAVGVGITGIGVLTGSASARSLRAAGASQVIRSIATLDEGI